MRWPFGRTRAREASTPEHMAVSLFTSLTRPADGVCDGKPREWQNEFWFLQAFAVDFALSSAVVREPARQPFFEQTREAFNRELIRFASTTPLGAKFATSVEERFIAYGRAWDADSHVPPQMRVAEQFLCFVTGERYSGIHDIHNVTLAFQNLLDAAVATLSQRPPK